MGYVIKSGNICVSSFWINTNEKHIFISACSPPALIQDYDTAQALAFAMDSLFPDRAPFHVERTRLVSVKKIVSEPPSNPYTSRLLAISDLTGLSFKEVYRSIVRDYLDSCDSYDLFSGFVSDISEEV